MRQDIEILVLAYAGSAAVLAATLLSVLADSIWLPSLCGFACGMWVRLLTDAER
jgi:hypothetical protein